MAQITGNTTGNWALVPLVPANFDERIDDIDQRYDQLEAGFFASAPFSASGSTLKAFVEGGIMTIKGSGLTGSRPVVKSVSWSNGDDAFKASGSLRYTGNEDFLGGTLKSATLTVDGESITMVGNVVIQANGNFAGTVTRLSWDEDGNTFSATGSFSVQQIAGNTTVGGTATGFSVTSAQGSLTVTGISIPLSTLGSVDTVAELLALLPANLPGNEIISYTTDGTALLGGGAGNDTYILTSSSQTAAEQAGEGIDTLRVAYNTGSFFTVSLHLFPEIENIDVVGTGEFGLSGSDASNWLRGNASANFLQGLLGADTLIGGRGNDVYTVDSADTVVEAAKKGGIDTMQSAESTTLAANVEKLFLTGTDPVSGTGNNLANVLSGNSAANVLTGLKGNDIYLVGAGDTVVEAANGGTDTVYASVDYALGANVENLAADTSDPLALTGNALANVITGGNDNDTIDGGAGADRMLGATGDDEYTVDNARDLVIELDGQGEDSVTSSVSYTLRAFVENLTLTGAAVVGVGNAQQNEITGNALANRLDGKAGADTLTGGAGNDLFLFSGRDGTVDTITDFTPGSDKLVFDNDFFKVGKKGALAAARFDSGPGMTEADVVPEWLVYDTTTGDLYYDTNGALAGGSVGIAILTGAPTLTAADILVVE